MNYDIPLLMISVLDLVYLGTSFFNERYHYSNSMDLFMFTLNLIAIFLSLYQIFNAC